MGGGERVSGYAVLHELFNQFACGHTADVQSEQKLLDYIMKMAQLNAMLISLQRQLRRFQLRKVRIRRTPGKAVRLPDAVTSFRVPRRWLFGTEKTRAYMLPYLCFWVWEY